MACVNIVGKKVLSGLLQTPTSRFSERICLVNHMSLYTSRNKSYSSDQNELPYSHDLQSREHEFSNVDRIGEASRVSSHNDQVRSGNAVSDRNNDCYQQISNVSLYSVMQTNVPHPYTSRPGHLNMPGGGIKLRDKYTSSFRHDVHPANGNFNGTKQFSTFSVLLSAKEDPFYSYGMRSEDMQGVQGPIGSLENQTVGSLSQADNPCPQGIQGSDCEKFKLWLENCTKYSYLNCDEQLQHLKEGRKTLAQIFEEQEKVISEVVREYQTKQATHKRD